MVTKFFLAGISVCLLGCASAQSWKLPDPELATRWTKEVGPNNAHKEYPRPQMVRSNWQNLNGLWNYKITDTTKKNEPSIYDGEILVPYPIESVLSGVRKALQPSQYLWYKRVFKTAARKKGDHVLLHFGAVDWRTKVFINGHFVGSHEGGYDHFDFDITEFLRGEQNTIAVQVWDPTDEGYGPRGKQTLFPEGIDYTSTSGIWQTVWLETVGNTSIARLKITPDVDKKCVSIAIERNHFNEADRFCDVEISVSDQSKIIARYKGQFGEAIELPIKEPHLWSPDTPFLYNLDVRLLEKGAVADHVKSYFGMRKISIEKDEKGSDRIYLNNHFIYNLGVLDQGFWPDGIYTAPTDEALAFDIKAIKAMGFNTIRKHIKIEPDRWYYYCDKLGMMVWQDMINPAKIVDNNRTDSQISQLIRNARNAFEQSNNRHIDQLYNFPCITTWVLFNEGWGAYDQERLALWMKKKDASRLLDGHTGSILWGGYDLAELTKKSAYSDFTDSHYPLDFSLPPSLPGKARVIGEYGQKTLAVENHMWLYTAYPNQWDLDSLTDFRKYYEDYSAELVKMKQAGGSGSIFTQPFDVEEELNGLITYDRAVIKIPIKEIRRINAKIWPPTKHSGELENPLKLADAKADSISYASRIALFRNGCRDSAFLVNLSIVAASLRDTNTMISANDELVKIMKCPTLFRNLNFMKSFTVRVEQPGFKILVSQSDRLPDMIDRQALIYKLETVLFNERIQPILLKSHSPDWKSIVSLIDIYKMKGYVTLLKCIEYFDSNGNWHAPEIDNILQAAEIYRQRDGNMEKIYGLADRILTYSTKKEELKKACEWYEAYMKIHPSDDFRQANYALTLYRLGRIEEALRLEENVIKLLHHNNRPVGSAQQVLEKMKSGELIGKPVTDN